MAPRAEIGLDAIAPYLLGGHKARRLIFVNGHVVPELSHVQSLPRGRSFDGNYLPVTKTHDVLALFGSNTNDYNEVDVAEILPLVRLDRPASAPRALAGFMNLGGAPTPVLRLAVLMGGEPVADE